MEIAFLKKILICPIKNISYSTIAIKMFPNMLLFLNYLIPKKYLTFYYLKACVLA